MFVFAILAVVSAAATGAPMLPTHLLSLETGLTGLLNLLHVGSSYVAFEQLAGGNAMSLFYIYPILNVLGAVAVLGEKVPTGSIPWLLLAFLGAILVSQPSPTHWSMVGVVGALLAAATETGIYLWFKHKKEGESSQPWTKMAQMYGSSGVFWLLGAVLLLAVGAIGPKLFSISRGGLSHVLLFNAIVGFTGYALRFYLIPQISTITFSVLSFFGVISAYLFGWLLSNEIPTTVQAVGAAAIIVANGVLLQTGEFV
jgi:drug/metabolite transporter (DMT)-like permease